MRLMHCSMLIVLTLVMMVGSSRNAQAQSFVRLGEAQVSLASGRATVNLTGGALIDRIQIESKNHAVQVQSATVTFADGRVQVLGSMLLSPNYRSTELALAGAGTPIGVSLVFQRQARAYTGIVIYGHVALARPSAPATSDLSANRRKTYRMSKGSRPIESPQPAKEADAASERAAAESQQREQQEAAAKRLADERARQEQSRQGAARQSATRGPSMTSPMARPAAPAAPDAQAPGAQAPRVQAPGQPPLGSAPPSTITGRRLPDARSPAGGGAGQPTITPPTLPKIVAGDACKDRSICTPVPVFFGTDRKEVPNPDRIDFGADRDRRLHLGQAIVTVPRIKRQAGKVLRPTLFETLVLRIPEQGDPARHFTIPKNGVTVMTEEQFLMAVSNHRDNAGAFKDHAFVFVHGYNTAFDSALYRTAQIAFDLSDVAGSEADRVPFGTAFLYSWPSGGGAVDYVYDHESSRGAESHFRDFLDLVIAKTGAKHVHLIAHSLGNSVLLNVLQDYEMPKSAKATISQVILAAPAIDAEEFGVIASKIKKLTTGGITLYASSNDRALSAASRLNRGRPMAGDVPSGGPIIVAGIDSIDVSGIPTDSFWGHDRYADRRELLEDIWRLVSKGVRPPDSRSQLFKIEGKPGAVYWRYAQ